MRLQFHDCAVRVHASILLNHTGSERLAAASMTLMGFELIDYIKAALKKSCPGTTSCTDILTSAATDETVAAGGPFWMVPYRRRDGWVSVAAETQNVPMGYENTDTLYLGGTHDREVHERINPGRYKTTTTARASPTLPSTREEDGAPAHGPTNPIVAAFVNEPFFFYQQFSVSMVKLGNIDILTSNEGEVRTNLDRP
ncbi:hypothetical protein MLD38_024883 [Melastoma candidum]|uniref:Uncharacterized protein n=1 Tax=Melastoma candidum TaxID=119954 RepID=A0ACB9NTR4_9MYRT|nr:hypothetical protein MLD38_024883 [Melastoma candidum]